MSTTGFKKKNVAFLLFTLAFLMSLNIAYEYSDNLIRLQVPKYINSYSTFYKAVMSDTRVSIAYSSIHQQIVTPPLRFVKSTTSTEAYSTAHIVEYATHSREHQRSGIPLDGHASSVIGPNCSKPTSRQVLKLYPQNGTGTTVNISGDFKFSTFSSFCVRCPNMTAIIPIYSAAGNFERRDAIRSTIGKDCIEYNCKVFFIIGVSCDKTVYRKVKDEYDDKQDILMINKVDTYWDLNNKAVAMLSFLIKFCPHPKYVIHLVDDTYPNIKLFLNHLNSISETKFIFGHILSHFKAHRNPKIKGYVSKAEYPHRFYPNYVMGFAYAFLTSESAVLLDKAYTAPYIWIEDVWFTGFVRQLAGFKAIEPRRRHIHGSAANMPQLWSKVSSAHPVSVQGFYHIYDRTRH